MPNRVYMNRCTGEERVHIEITRDEIREMLARPAGPEARALWGLLATADHQFSGVTPVDPRWADPAAGPRCVCGDPIERWSGPGESGWIHSPGSDTTCLDARPPIRRRLTELEHSAAWHAIEGTASEEGADPGTVLAAVLRALGIDPPGEDAMAASLRRDGFGDDEIAEILRHDDALCGHCGVPKGSHHHPWTSTADAIAGAPQNAANPTP